MSLHCFLFIHPFIQAADARAEEMMPPKKSRAARELDDTHAREVNGHQAEDHVTEPAGDAEEEEKNIFKVEIIHSKRERTVPKHETVFQVWYVQGPVTSAKRSSLKPHSHRTRKQICTKFACKPFDVACNLCEHSHSL